MVSIEKNVIQVDGDNIVTLRSITLHGEPVTVCSLWDKYTPVIVGVDDLAEVAKLAKAWRPEPEK